MNVVSGVTTKTPSRIPFGAGVYFKGATYDEKVAPALDEIKNLIFGATQDGGSVTITPEFFMPELDGVTVAVAELQQKVGEAASMETSIAELTPDLIKNMVIGKMEDSTDKNYDVITSGDLGPGHFYEGFGYYGQHVNGRPIIIIFKKALCTSGFASENKNKTNTVFKGTFECQSDIAYGTSKLPYAIFLYKEDKWTPVDPAEVAE